MKKAIQYSLAVMLGLAVAGCSKEESTAGLSGSARSIEDGGHKGVQLWKDGPYWAETNIGAERPWEGGYYFWWGDTIGYKRVDGNWFASDGSPVGVSFVDGKTYGKDMATLQHEGWCGEDGTLSKQHDAAHVHWGGNWRMPTSQEMKDLCSNCDWTWTTTNGVKGSVVQGRGDYASASIFLPVDSIAFGLIGNCWSSNPVPAKDCYAVRLFFGARFHEEEECNRDVGQPVRPVQGGSK